MRVIDEIKNYIHVNPDWVDNHIIPKDNIEETGTQYAKEAIAKGTIADDIETLLSELDRLRNPKSDAEKDFYEIAFVGYNVIKAKRLANIYAIFIKGIISELNGKAICTAAQIEEWRERYAVKLEGLKGKTTAKAGNETRSLEPILYSRAKQIYKALIDYSLIDCEESDFTNLFCVAPGKHYDKAPNTIEWKGKVKLELAIFWESMCYFSTGIYRAEWEQLPLYIKTELNVNRFDLSGPKKKKNAYYSNRIKLLFSRIEDEEKKENEQRKVNAQLEAEKEKWIDKYFK